MKAEFWQNNNVIVQKDIKRIKRIQNVKKYKQFKKMKKKMKKMKRNNIFQENQSYY